MPYYGCILYPIHSYLPEKFEMSGMVSLLSLIAPVNTDLDRVYSDGFFASSIKIAVSSSSLIDP